jgi:hypothetical protein
MWASSSKAFCIEFLAEIHKDSNGIWASSSRALCIKFRLEFNKARPHKGNPYASSGLGRGIGGELENDCFCNLC